MQSDPQAALRALVPAHEFFVGVDSDGCAFNSMEVKHNDCFSVNVVKHFGLAGVSRQVHEAWDFVNLYSRTRGCNRFKALLSVLDYVRAMPKVMQSGVQVPRLTHLRSWVQAESKLGNPALQARIEATSGPERDELTKVLDWSLGVNAFVADIVKNLPPFVGARAALEALQGKADVLVVSATPEEALLREWREHDIEKHVRLIAGQEMGSKVEHLTLAAQGRYQPDAILMVGDAPGDLKAAQAVGALFFPIVPGHEEASWKRLVSAGLQRFYQKSYAGAYQDSLLEDFMSQLPAVPPFDVQGA